VTCQCDVIPERPCPAPVTQEDLLCDTCREARKPGMIHASMTFTGSTVRTSHLAIDARVFAPEGYIPDGNLPCWYWPGQPVTCASGTSYTSPEVSGSTVALS
jgi:hypothetical protein